jgi:hypothetical protein
MSAFRRRAGVTSGFPRCVETVGGSTQMPQQGEFDVINRCSYPREVPGSTSTAEF